MIRLVHSCKSVAHHCSARSYSMSVTILLMSILSAVLIYLVAENLFTPPPLPEMDKDRWWGPLAIDMKQNEDTTIKPFTIEFSDVIVNDLKERLLHRRPFAPPLENSGFTNGFNTDYLTRILDFWQNDYKFKEREQFLNQYDHFLTNIRGLDIHFVHLKPKPVDNVEIVPLLLIHGWPGSFRQFYDVMPKLVEQRPDKNFVFELIIPSIPGFAYSQAPVRSGMGPKEVAIIFRKLMRRIGHKEFFVHGGGYGHDIGSIMSTYFPNEILGFHTNTPFVQHSNIFAFAYTMLGSIWPSMWLPPDEGEKMYHIKTHVKRKIEESGYYLIQSSKPDTVGVGLSDSPAGLAAYILEKFSTWTNIRYKEANDGGLLNKFNLTSLLDNVMIYWVTNTITSSMRHYMFRYDQLNIMDRIPTTVPTCSIKFKNEIMYQSDEIFRQKYINLLQSTVVEDGGHFAAMENPYALADNLFDSVELIRSYRECKKNQNCNNKDETKTETKLKTIYDFIVNDIHGNEVKLDKYKGHVLIVVNVASQCGYTDTHYTQLNKLYKKYGQTHGLRILAFPCNQFANQEPGSLEEIMKFAENRNVTFDLFEKIDVNGENAHPLWQFLKMAQSGTFGDFIKWNFSKFIVDKHGKPVERFGPNVSPMELESYLEKYW